MRQPKRPAPRSRVQKALLLTLLCVPSIALVILGANLSARTFTTAAWIFAAYFATAWLLLLGVIVRPDYVTRTMLAVVVVIALVTQRLASTLETAPHSSDTTLGLSIALPTRSPTPAGLG